ncbi:hypothetical protein EV182_003579 [Spiromyces aspiralis]|uniref:Uncharacterized protein n=1 Tax=Spiromyces aspiralis TaxID=68401 RepID=A0ACC1HTK1_9FUNG|nr:hypothetical protein EV182_003579 [Spiromyces aspiralis]
MSTEKIYVVGGTGNSGQKVIRDLVKQGVPTTAFVGDRARAERVLGMASHLEFVVRDYDNLDAFERSIEGHTHLLGIAGRGTLVAIRPSRFMSNQFWFDLPTIKESGAIFNAQGGDKGLEWISTDDIADVATHMLTGPVEKHGDAVYELIDDDCSGVPL